MSIRAAVTSILSVCTLGTLTIPIIHSATKQTLNNEFENFIKTVSLDDFKKEEDYGFIVYNSDNNDDFQTFLSNQLGGNVSKLLRDKEEESKVKTNTFKNLLNGIRSSDEDKDWVKEEKALYELCLSISNSTSSSVLFAKDKDLFSDYVNYCALREWFEYLPDKTSDSKINSLIKTEELKTTNKTIPTNSP